MCRPLPDVNLPGSRIARAFVVRAGDDPCPVSESVEGIGVRALAGELRARA